MPPCGDREERERDTYADHQRDQRRVKFMIHRHDACPDHWAHRRLEYGHAEHLLLRAQHTLEEEENLAGPTTSLNTSPTTIGCILPRTWLSCSW